MSEQNLVGDALVIMVLGMGVVFTFLTVMVFVLKLQAKLINKFFKEEEKKPTQTKQWQPNTNNDDAQTAAAITAAIIHHNNKKG